MGMNEKERGAEERQAQVPPGASGAVELHIEELLLHGFSPRDRYAIRDAVEHELTRLIVSGGLPCIAAETVIERLDGGRFKVAQDVKPGAAGKQLAQTLYRGMASVAGNGAAQGARPGNGKRK